VALALSPTEQFINNMGITTQGGRYEVGQALTNADQSLLKNFNAEYEQALRNSKTPAEAAQSSLFAIALTPHPQATENFRTIVHQALDVSAHQALAENQLKLAESLFVAVANVQEHMNGHGGKDFEKIGKAAFNQEFQHQKEVAARRNEELMRAGRGASGQTEVEARHAPPYPRRDHGSARQQAQRGGHRHAMPAMAQGDDGVDRRGPMASDHDSDRLMTQEQENGHRGRGFVTNGMLEREKQAGVRTIPGHEGTAPIKEADLPPAAPRAKSPNPTQVASGSGRLPNAPHPFG
jgi:hypothetical protein